MTVSVATEQVQLGTTKSVVIAYESSPAQYGKAGAFTVDGALLKLVTGGTVVDYSAVLPAGWTDTIVEVGSHPSGYATTSVTADPVYSAAGGPAGENIIDVTVQSSAAFSVGQYVRAQNQPSGEGHIHEIVQIPDGTSLYLHSSSTAYDIEDGDTIERVVPTGVYVGIIDVVVSTYFDIDEPTAVLDVSITGQNGVTPDPEFSADVAASFVVNLELDLAGRTFRTG